MKRGFLKQYINGRGDNRVPSTSTETFRLTRLFPPVSSPPFNGLRSSLSVSVSFQCLPATGRQTPQCTQTRLTVSGCRFFGSSSQQGLSNRSKVLDVNKLPKRILDCQYAVRGEIVDRSFEIENDLKNGVKYPFKNTVAANIGNPQALGQLPVTFYRQIMSGLCYPDLLSSSILPSDVVERCQRYLSAALSVGAYSHSKGLLAYREEVAQWLTERDGFPADPEAIFLTDGASQAVRLILEMLIGTAKDGVLIPIPQYPLFSATITRLGGSGLHYYLQEETNWLLDMSSIEAAWNEAEKAGICAKALVVINPGNPTGGVQDRATIEKICRFCFKHNLVLLADEVYQANVYVDKPFISCRRVAHELGLDLEVVSFQSCSKGVSGECGIRGGLMHLENISPEIIAQAYKLSSMSLCSNTLGQAVVACMVRPPVAGEPSYDLYKSQTSAIHNTLRRKSELVSNRLNQIKGVSCQRVEGAMYAFPRVDLPQAAIDEAAKEGVQPDLFYCKKMLEKTGVVTVPGSGFGQVKGTWHYRTTILPEESRLGEVLSDMEQFHNEFMSKYSG